MNVKKFTAGSSRDAWRQIRETLGPDAVIFSNRNTDDGVEILAMASEDMPALAMSRQAMQQPPVQQRVAVSRDANGSGIEPSQAIEHSAAQTEARVWRTRKAVRTKE